MRTDAFTGNVNWPVYGWKALGEDEVTFVQCVKEAGYYTALVYDTSHMVTTGFGRDFDEDIFIEPPEGWEENEAKVELPVPREHMRQNGQLFIKDRARTMHCKHETDWFVARTMLAASRWLEDNRKRDRFVLWIDTFEIHEDWYAPDFYTEHYSPNYQGLDYSYPNYGYADIYSEAELERMRARYAAEVTLTDRWVGHLLRTVELMGLFENTMVAIVSDHGMYLGEHNRTGKHTVTPNEPWPIYDEVGRIPLLIRIPGKRQTRRSGALVQPADLMPTILDVCQASAPQTYGRSLFPILGGHTKNHHRYIFTSCHSGPGAGRIVYLPSCITVTSRRWTLVTGPESWHPELYDRKHDPKQQRNVIEKWPKVAAKLREALVKFMRERGADEEYIKGHTQVLPRE
jgi:arylsulfatase A-like enzyme